MMDASLPAGLASIPEGNWAVGVSGGADSVALLHMLRAVRPDLHLVVAHLNHQTRGEESDADESFVRDLCARVNVQCRIARRDEIERESTDWPANLSAKYRAMRFAWFNRVVSSEKLDGVVLAHHADDQAETVLQRLLRGTGYASLAGISPRATVRGVLLLRPLLSVRRDVLRAFLHERDLSWREDSSNRSPKYLRNRLRAILRGRDELVDALLELSRACAKLKTFCRRVAPALSGSFAVGSLDDLPSIVARESAKRWLRDHRVPADQIDRATIDRLRTMAADAGSANRQQFPGGVFVRRRSGIISAE
jgi:tRNA(Ile)-lysidine synthase